MKRQRDWPIIIGGTIVAVIVALAAAMLVVATYFAFTGGFTTVDTERINGQKCVVTRDRLDNTVKQVDCGKVRP